jgi:ubiquitin carboxyl-terminal hydrolase 10
VSQISVPKICCFPNGSIQPRNVETISDALLNLGVPETVSMSSGVDVTKQVFLDALPPILILHLKRFNYDPVNGQAVKNAKVVRYGTELEIPSQVLTPGRRTRPLPRYGLFGVVYHHGKSAAGGHYTASVRQQTGQWLNIDDTLLRNVGINEVAVDEKRKTEDRTPYLLFYMRK